MWVCTSSVDNADWQSLPSSTRGLTSAQQLLDSTSSQVFKIPESTLLKIIIPQADIPQPQEESKKLNNVAKPS